MTTGSSLLCAIAIAGAGCTTSERGGSEHSNASGRSARSQAKEALFAADAAQTRSIAKLGAVEGLTQDMRDDALYLADGLPVIRGRREVSSALQADKQIASAMLSRALTGGDASVDGRIGFTFGWAQGTPPSPEAGKTASHATYVAAWTRAGSGDPFRLAAYFTRASPGPQPATRDGFPLLAGGAGVSGVPHPGDVEQQKRSLLRADAEFSAYSVAHGYTLAFAAYAAEFTMAFGRNFAFLVGRQEVLDFYKGWTPAEVLEWTPLLAESSESGDLGYTVGTSVTTTRKPDGAVERAYNKYLSFWARRADGSWRFVADGGASAPEPSS